MFIDPSPDRKRVAGATGRHDGQEYWTLPGGGVDDGESLESAVRREVAEETGLTVRTARYLYDFPYPSGRTACFAVTTDPGEPRLGVDEELTCDCPRIVGLSWIPLPDVRPDSAGVPIPTLILASELGRIGTARQHKHHNDTDRR